MQEIRSSKHPLITGICDPNKSRGRHHRSFYKCFIRPHLDYGDVIYDQPLNESLSNRIESVQYKAALAITGVMQGSSREKLYKELGLEHLYQRRWMRQLCSFCKVFHNKALKYIYSLIPSTRASARQPNTFTSF